MSTGGLAKTTTEEKQKKRDHPLHSSESGFAFILRQRWLILIVSMVFLAVAGYGIGFLTVKTDYRYFFKQDNPLIVSHDRLYDTYTAAETAMIILAPKNGDVFTKQTLTQISDMSQELWTTPFSVRVDSLANFQRTFSEDDTLTVVDLIPDPEQLSQSEIEEIKQVALNEEELVGRIVSETGHVTGIVTSFRLPGEAPTEFTDSALAVREIADKYRQLYPDTDIHITGMLMANQAGIDVIIEDSQVLAPLMGLVIVVLLALLFRSILATFATVIIILYSLIAAVGLAGWVGYFFSGPSSSAPIVIITIAVADCVHVLISFFHATSQGKTKDEAILESLAVNRTPVIITSITTAIGFLSMNFSEIPPFHILGNVVAAGVVIACIISLTLLPALISILPISPRKKRTSEGTFMTPLATHVMAYRRPYFYGMMALTVAMAWFAQTNQVNDQFAKYFDHTVDFRRSTDFASENLSSVHNISFSVKSDYEGGVYNPEYLKQLDALVEMLRQHPDVIQVQALTDTFKRLNRTMHGEQAEWYRVPDDRELAAQYFLLYELNLPFGLDANHQVSFDKTESKILVTLKELSTNEMLATEKNLEGVFEQHFPQLEYYKSGVMLMFSHAGVSNAHAMIKGTVGALILMSIVIGLSLKSTKYGLVSFVANVFPAILAFGVWGIVFGEVGMSVAISIGMTLGIVVDNTVHLLSKYKRGMAANGQQVEKAIEYAFSHVGIALLVCNVVLIAGFAILSQSHFFLNSHMGYFTAMTFILALVVDFLLLPPILAWVDRRSSASTKPSAVLSMD